MKLPKRVLILGPESTGKSTLASDLAAHFGEPWVPEFAREYLENLDRLYQYEDLSTMALGQIESEDSLAKKAKEFLFCDTDLRVIHIWSEHKYGKTESWILDDIEKRSYDLILLTDIDLPWEPDPQRENPQPEMRIYFLKKYKQLALESGVPFSLVSGDRSSRLEKALEFIQG